MCYATVYTDSRQKVTTEFKMINVLFVCLGNICRSPLAEAIFRKKIVELNLQNLIECDSAGTANYHVGHLPDPRTIEVANRHFVPIDHHGQQFSRRDGETFDYLMAMDSSNYRNMVAEMGVKPDSLFLMRYFDPENKGADVPDPYYGGSDGFEEMYQILDRSLDQLVVFLKEKHKLA